MKKLLVLLLFCFMAILTACADVSSDIDGKEEQCINKVKSTDAMLICTNAAQEAWENELDKYYGLLKKTLDEEDKVVLEKAQKAWLEYKENQFDLINSVILEKQGTMYINAASGYRRRLVKQRAIELRTFYKTITE